MSEDDLRRVNETREGQNYGVALKITSAPGVEFEAIFPAEGAGRHVGVCN